MKRSVLPVTIGCVCALLASLLLARVHPFGDAGLYAADTIQPIMQHSQVPSEVRATLIAKCADCHSSHPHTPLYGRFAPVSWLLERDIFEARRAMNLSLWESYSAEEQETFKVKIMLETKAHKMPLVRYRAVHWDTRITDADIRTFTQWSRGASPTLNSVTLVSTEGDAVQGKIVFEKRCTGCHAMDQNREGPQLRGIFGRTSGRVANFTYSSALKNANILWNETTLEQWLADPDQLVPGNNMEFRVAKPQERRDLIRFLEESIEK